MILYWILLVLAAQLDVLMDGWYTGAWLSAPSGMVGLYYDWVAGRLEAAVWAGLDPVPVWHWWSVVLTGW